MSTWRAGDRALVRGDLWTVVESTAFAGCEALRLSKAGPANRGTTRTILTPFDRPVRVEPRRSLQIVRPRRWRHAVQRLASGARPLGAVSAAACAAIDLLPYQLEPALAILRRGACRVMIADAVGLGKTIQAGLILNELASRRESFRALVVCPAGLRDQWSHELGSRFGLAPTIAGAQWLASIGREIPPDVNPWILPGIYISSLDFIKRPEVLRPLEDATWDVLVVDEAHAAAIGTGRRAAVHAAALRARCVILLTATPHTGDADQFHALCAIGEAQAGDALTLFRRARADVGAGVGPHTGRRTAMLPVRLSAAEIEMHRLLEAYTARVCRHARTRGDARARLAVMVLRKRALSSAASLAVSCRKRLMLLAGADDPAEERQLLLPLGDEDPLDDQAPDAILAAPGLADSARERRWLAAITESAHLAARRESKARVLMRLLSRMREPAIVFTEYRDTLERLRSVISTSHPDVAVLHGAMTLTERSAVQRAFNAGGSLLLATDAASEGLNLHSRCRAVIHYELPWSPARMEQRTGRVDRIGQQRRVHEIIMVADDTAERLVLAPLARRAVRAGRSLTGASRLLDLLTESRIAGAIMDGRSIDAGDIGTGEPHAAVAAVSTDAIVEAERLAQQRAWAAASGADAADQRIAVSVMRLRRQPGIICVYMLTLVAEDGTSAHAEIVPVHVAEAVQDRRWTSAAVRHLAREFLHDREHLVHDAAAERVAPRVHAVEHQWAAAWTTRQARERALAAGAPSAAQQLVQAGLFDQRAMRASAARSRAAAVLLEDAGQRRSSLASATLTASLDLRAILIVPNRASS